MKKKFESRARVVVATLEESEMEKLVGASGGDGKVARVREAETVSELWKG